MQGPAQLRFLFDQLVDRQPVRPVVMQRLFGIHTFEPSVDTQCFRDAVPAVEPCNRGCLIHHILGHFPVGGPFAAGYGNQPGKGDDQRMVSRQRRGA